MADTQFDPTSFKSQQREQWSDVAQGWRRRWQTFEQGAQPLSDRMMEMAHIASGQRVLDVATGIGEPAMTAARVVGPGGAVVAIDQAPQMLAIARERMQAAGIHNVELIEGDAEAMTLPQDSFDAIVCRWGMMFFHDPVGTLARLRTSLKPDGWMVAAVWGSPERVPLISLPSTVLTREMGVARPPSLPGGPNPFALSESTTLEHLTRDAGFVDVRSESFTVTYEFRSTDELLEHIRDVSAPIRSITATLSAERQAEFWGKLADAAVVFAGADGMVRLPNDSLIVAGQR